MIRRTRSESDDGYTLVELLVALMITSIVLVMVGTFFGNVGRMTASAKLNRDASGQIGLAIASVRSVVSLATDNATSSTATDPAVVSGTTTSLTVTSYGNTIASSPAPAKYTYSIDANGYLKEARVPGVLASTGYWTFTGTAVERRVAGPFTTTGGTPFFSYLNQSGTVISLSANALATTDRGSVAFVRVTPRVAVVNGAGASDVVVATTAIGLTDVLRNVDGAVTLPTLVGGN